jgi:photosystem II stability/assembly factor-like uncharacterized protein
MRPPDRSKMNTSCAPLAAGFVIVLLGLLAPLAAAAAETASGPLWVPAGPTGGSVSSVAAASNGRTVYAAAGGSVWKSVNRGRGWQLMRDGLSGPVGRLLSPRSAPATVYAGLGTVFDTHLFVSVDAARHWVNAGANLPPNGGILTFDASASDPAVIYVLTYIFQGARGKGYRSSDFGAHWQSLGDLPNTEDWITVVVHPELPDVALVGGTGGAWKTVDGGRHWSAAGLAGLEVRLLEFDRVQPDRLYAHARQHKSAQNPTPPLRIYASEDGGASWALRGDNLNGVSLISLLADPTQASTLYGVEDRFAPYFPQPARIFKSADGGTSWEALGKDIADFPLVGSLAIDPTRSGVLYAGRFPSEPAEETGLFRSVDGGKTWTPSAHGIQSSAVTSLAVDPQTAGVVYAGLEGSVFKTSDGGESWTAAGLKNQALSLLTLDRDSPATLYAATGTRTYRSIDGASGWELWGSSPPELSLLTVFEGILYAANPGGPSKWDAAAARWLPVGGGETHALAVVRRLTGTMVWYDDATYIENGTDFIRRGLEGDFQNQPTVLSVVGQATAIVIDPQKPAHLGITYHQDVGPPAGGLYLTNANGRSWRHPVVGSGATPLWSFAIDPGDSDHLVAGGNGRVFESRDDGATWSEIDAGLAVAVVSALVFDGQTPARLYAATLGGGVYLLTRPQN